MASAILLVLATASAARAQVETDVDALREIAAREAQRWAEQQALVDLWCNLTGMPRRWSGPDGSVVEMMGFDAEGWPRYYGTCNRSAADTVAVDELWPGGSTGLDLTGDDVVLGIWDAGAVRVTHQEFGGRAIQSDSAQAQDDHATHVSGTMIASGVRAEARGMAYEADLRCHDWNSDTSELATEAAKADPARSSNHSYAYRAGWWVTDSSSPAWFWGGNVAVSTLEDALFGRYTDVARGFDEVAFNAPFLLICVAAGNDRDQGPTTQPVLHLHGDGNWHTDQHPTDGPHDSVTDPATAKNVLTVGAVLDVPGGFESAQGATMTTFSSWGPVDDGRIKPEVVANGHELLSTLANSDSAYNIYDWSGTSMATPTISAGLGLVARHYWNTHVDNQVHQWPRAATLKAIAIHTARDLGNPGPDYTYGFGLADLREAADLVSLDASQAETIVEEMLEDGKKYRRRIDAVDVAGGNGEVSLKFTLAWTDRPGTPVVAPQGQEHLLLDNPTRMLVNDLDIKLYHYNGTGTVLGRPWVLNPAIPAQNATTGDNDRDVVEVLEKNVAPGSYLVEVSHKGTLAGGSQAFSLISTGGSNLPTTRVNVASFGEQRAGADSLAISADGRIVVFETIESLLVPGDTNGANDIFAHDRQTGLTTRVSVTSSGAQVDGWSQRPSVSKDGRFVAFEGPSSLTPGTGSTSFIVAVRDREAELTSTVSLSSTGVKQWGGNPSISADGRFVAFDSTAKLVPEDTNADYDVYVRDRTAGFTQLVSLSPITGQMGNSSSLSASISGDGRWVVFSSLATDLVPGDTNSVPDIFVYDREGGFMTRVSVSNTGQQANGWSIGAPSISKDGRFVAFVSAATNLVTGDTNNRNDIFVRDRLGGSTTRVSVSASGQQVNSHSFEPSISADGRFVAFRCSANDLVPGDTNPADDVFIHDLWWSNTTLVHLSSSGAQGLGAASLPRVSQDGRFIAFRSLAANLVSGDSNGALDLFVRDRHLLPIAPAAADVCSGAAVALLVNSADESFTDATWRRNGSYVVGAPRSLPLTINAASPAHAGIYDAVLGSGILGSADAIPFTGRSRLLVKAPPVLIQPPTGIIRRNLTGGLEFFSSNVVAATGDRIVLFGYATGRPVLYTWRRNGVPVPGADKATHSFHVSGANAGAYTVTARNDCGMTTSTPITITVGGVGVFLRPGP